MGGSIEDYPLGDLLGADVMALTKEEKTEVIGEFHRHENDTGSPEVQVAILTRRIHQLTDHLRVHKHDYHTQRGLMKLVGQRRRLQRYLRKNNPQSYQSIIAKLKIRD